jgi:hypothetical protein
MDVCIRCTYIYINIYLYIYIYAYIHTYIHGYRHLHSITYTHVHIHTNTHVHIHIQAYTYTYTNTDARMHRHTRKYTYAYTHTHTHTHTQALGCIITELVTHKHVVDRVPGSAFSRNQGAVAQAVAEVGIRDPALGILCRLLLEVDPEKRPSGVLLCWSLVDVLWMLCGVCWSWLFVLCAVY